MFSAFLRLQKIRCLGGSLVAELQLKVQMSRRGHTGPALPGARTVDGPTTSKVKSTKPSDVSRKFADGVSRHMKVERRPGILPMIEENAPAELIHGQAKSRPKWSGWHAP